MHFPLIFHIQHLMYGLYFLPGSNFAPFEEVKVPVSNSAEFFQKSAPWRILMDLGWVRVKRYWTLKYELLLRPSTTGKFFIIILYGIKHNKYKSQYTKQNITSSTHAREWTS